MKRNALIFFFFFLFSFPSVFKAQQNTIDSLLNFLKTSKEDTIQVNVLNALCVKYRSMANFKVALPYAQWLKQLPGTPVFVGYPAGFDFMFVYWYLLYFVGESPFARRALDIRTFAMAQLKKPYLAVSREQLPERYRGESPHTHQALDDALEQGTIFCKLLLENLQT